MDFELVFVLNLGPRGAFHVVRPIFSLMCEAGHGRVALTASVDGSYAYRNSLTAAWRNRASSDCPAVRSTVGPVILPVVPLGQVAYIRRGFDMAKAGGAKPPH